MNVKPKEKFKPEDYMNALAPVELEEPNNLPAVVMHPERYVAVPLPTAPVYSTRIATALADIMGEIGGVAKHGENKFHNYKYVRIEDILSKVTPLLASHGIVIIQSEVSRAMFDDDKVVSVTYSFTIAHKSGDVWPEKAMHTGMSNARNSKGGFDDKAFNKCHTAARKYFLKALFQITDDEDKTTDADSQEDSAPVRQAPPKLTDHDASKKADGLIREVKFAKSMADLDYLWKDNDFRAIYDALPTTEKSRVAQVGQRKRDDLKAAIDDEVPV